jgi:hypothetical protein
MTIRESKYNYSEIPAGACVEAGPFVCAILPGGGRFLASRSCAVPCVEQAQNQARLSNAAVSAL